MHDYSAALLDAFDNPHSGIKPADVAKVKQKVWV